MPELDADAEARITEILAILPPLTPQDRSEAVLIFLSVSPNRHEKAA